MTPKLQETSCGTACRLHADVLPHLKAGPVVAAAELHSVLGHEVWKGSLEAGEHAQSEICGLEIKASEGKGQPFEQKGVSLSLAMLMQDISCCITDLFAFFASLAGLGCSAPQREAGTSLEDAASGVCQCSVK